jgi:hypothetical protein
LHHTVEFFLFILIFSEEAILFQELSALIANFLL